MKVIGEQLIDGIKLNEFGKIEIDQSKINPKCIEVAENNVKIQELKSSIAARLSQKELPDPLGHRQKQ